MVMEGEDADAAFGFGLLAMAAGAKVFCTFGSSPNQIRSEVHSCPKKSLNSVGEYPTVSSPMASNLLALRSKSLNIFILAVLPVHQFLDRQGDYFLKRVSDKYAKISNGTSDAILEPPCADDSSLSETKSKSILLIRTDGLKDALLELGVPVERDQVEELMLIMDLDENGGLDFEEFKLAVQQPPTQLEQWASMLPLAGMLARSLPVNGGQGDPPLRDFSRLDEDEIDVAVEVFSEGMRTAHASKRYHEADV